MLYCLDVEMACSHSLYLVDGIAIVLQCPGLTVSHIDLRSSVWVWEGCDTLTPDISVHYPVSSMPRPCDRIFYYVLINNSTLQGATARTSLYMFSFVSTQTIFAYFMVNVIFRIVCACVVDHRAFSGSCIFFCSTNS